MLRLSSLHFSPISVSIFIIIIIKSLVICRVSLPSLSSVEQMLVTDVSMRHDVMVIYSRDFSLRFPSMPLIDCRRIDTRASAPVLRLEPRRAVRVQARYAARESPANRPNERRNLPILPFFPVTCPSFALSRLCHGSHTSVGSRYSAVSMHRHSNNGGRTC